MNKLNILSIAQKAVRDSGKTNMLDSNAVQYWAYQMGFFELVSWIEKERNRYVSFMALNDYDAIPSIDTEELLNEEEPLAARKIVLENFSKEIKEYKQTRFNKIERLPFTYEEFGDNGSNFYDFLREKCGEKHLMNYFFLPGNGKEYVLFKDGLYQVLSFGEELIDVEEWKEISSRKESFGPETKEQYEELNKLFRLKTLFI